jgi:isopenicillin N synthase-like dioxygenase
MVPTLNLCLPIISFKSPTVADEIRKACLTQLLPTHRPPQEMQDETLATMKSFFGLPTDVKMQLLKTDDRAGYEAIQSQKLEKGTIPNVKEGYYVGAPGHVWTGTKFGDNTWHRDPKYEKVFMAYYSAVYDLSKQLFAILARSLKLSETFFEDFLQDEVSLARHLHYPPTPSMTTARGVGAHTDFRAMTRLWQDTVSGLQIFHPKTQSWIDVTPIPGAYVVNLGDMMQLWTGGMYRSTLHRVVNTSGEQRYSIAFFNEGRLDYRVKRIIVGVGTEDEKRSTVEEHLKKWYKESYDVVNSE